MKHKCSGCIFEGCYQDMGASTPLCNRGPDDLLTALNKHSAPGPCKYYLTKSELIKLQDACLETKGD